MPQFGEASEHRRRIFGWLSIELLITFGAIICTVAMSHASLSSDVHSLSRENIELKAQMITVARDLIDARSDTRNAMTINAQQQGQLDSLQQSRDADRKILMDISSNVAVLLDRTDPRKKGP